MSTTPQIITPLAFRYLLISVIGKDRYLTLRTSPAAVYDNDTINLSDLIYYDDMLQYFNRMMCDDLLTQEDVDSLNAAWPVMQ